MKIRLCLKVPWQFQGFSLFSLSILSGLHPHPQIPPICYLFSNTSHSPTALLNLDPKFYLTTPTRMPHWHRTLNHPKLNSWPSIIFSSPKSLPLCVLPSLVNAFPCHVVIILGNHLPSLLPSHSTHHLIIPIYLLLSNSPTHLLPLI